MPFDRDATTGKIHFNFSNLLALVIVMGCFAFFFWICMPSKQSENRDIGEVKTALISVLTLVIGYYFGSTKGSAAKDVKIEEMTKTATALALNNPPGTSTEVINTENISGNVTADKVITENKTDANTPT